VSALDLARWQFAITTVYHFLFVPITIGLSFMVAMLETRYYRKRDPQMLRLALFFGKLFTINFALGLVTGIVQEFQFGMNWSVASRLAGDIFGAPLAVEALLAFFMESVFLGLWIFGRGKLPAKVHLATIWLVHIGTALSAWMILAANSWLQNPVGYKLNPLNGRVELTSFWHVMFQKVQLSTYFHTLFVSYMTGAAFVLAISLWLYRRDRVATDRSMYRYGALFGALVTLIAGIGVAVTGDIQGKIMTDVQPMKMAAAEGLQHTTKGAPFSVLTISSLDGKTEHVAITIPKLLSFLGTGSFNGTTKGFIDLQDQWTADCTGKPANGVQPAAGHDRAVPTVPVIAGLLQEKNLAPLSAQTVLTLLAAPDTENLFPTYIQDAYKADPVGGANAALVGALTCTAESITPMIPVTYWSFRLMILLGLIAGLIGIWVLIALRRSRGDAALRSRWLGRSGGAAAALLLLPVLASSFGWIFSEIGRQPWVANGLAPTQLGVSPGVTAGNVLTSLIVFVLLYGAFAVVEVGLTMRYAKPGAQPLPEEPSGAEVPDDSDRPLTFAY